MKRLGTLVLCIAILVLFLARDDDAPKAPAKGGAGDAPVFVPLPVETPAEAAERAIGFYVGEYANVRATLELRADRRFTFISQQGGEARRAASGTWSVAGVRLTLAYTHLEGKPIEGGPKTVLNVWRGDAIELRETGLPQTVTLTRRTAIRVR